MTIEEIVNATETKLLRQGYEGLNDFEKIVAREAARLAVQSERERCAKIISDLGDAEGKREFETPEETLRSVERQNTLYNASDALLLPPPSATATECLEGQHVVQDSKAEPNVCAKCGKPWSLKPPAVKRGGGDRRVMKRD